MGLYDEDNIVKGNWAKWDEVGKTYEGVYVETYQKPSKYKPGEMQDVYVLVDEDGASWNVVGPGNRSLGQFKNTPLGTFVGVKYTGDSDPKPGQNPAKSVCVFCEKDENGKPTDVRMDVLEKYQEIGRAHV